MEQRLGVIIPLRTKDRKEHKEKHICSDTVVKPEMLAKIQNHPDPALRFLLSSYATNLTMPSDQLALGESKMV